MHKEVKRYIIANKLGEQKCKPDEVAVYKGRGHWGLRYCGIELFFRMVFR